MLYSLETEIIDANNIGFHHTFYRRWRWHARKPWRFWTNTWLDNIIGIGNNIVLSEWKAFFGGILVLVVEVTNSLLTFPSWTFPVELSPYVNGQESNYPFTVNANESEYFKISESGNIYESGKISSSVNLVEDIVVEMANFHFPRFQ